MRPLPQRSPRGVPPGLPGESGYPPQSVLRSFEFTCDSCGTRLEKPGALVFSPPITNIVRKFHVCLKCFKEKFEPLLKALID